MGLRFIRKPSEIPNVQNVDDIRMARYAYGNQSGYIKGYGQELSHTIVGSTFLINSGIFVIQGAEIEIDANGWGESVSGVTNKRYYTVYGEVNLSLQIAEIKSTYSLSAYPDLPQSDDLTQSTDGTARVELYRFTATNGLIADIQKRIQPIKYSVELVADEKAEREQALTDAIASEVANRTTALGALNANIRTDLESGTLKAKIAEYASVDTAKGTIEQRLTSLGFRQGSVSLASGTATVNSVKRTGNYVIGEVRGSNLVGHIQKPSGTEIVGTLPTSFRPSSSVRCGVLISSDTTVKISNAIIKSNGEVEITMNAPSPYGILYLTGMFFGFEAPPIN